MVSLVCLLRLIMGIIKCVLGGWWLHQRENDNFTIGSSFSINT